MKIAIVLREQPVPIYTGLNVIVQNVLKRMMLLHQLNVFIVDQENSDQNFQYPVKFYQRNSPVPCNSSSHTLKISRVAKYYNTNLNKLEWLNREINFYSPDVIIGFGFNLLAYVGLLEIKVPKILDLIDAEPLFIWREIKVGKINYTRCKQLLASILLVKHFGRKCDALCTVSHDDSRMIKKILAHSEVYTIPNGVDSQFFQPDNAIKKNNDQVVFSGSLSWSPNRKAIEWFLENCWPLILEEKPEVQFIIIGKSPTELLKKHYESFPNVSMLGFVDDIRDYIRSSCVSIAPMISGSGIKNKILEAWAMGQPVVTTRLGAEGLICEDGKNILIGKNERSFADQVIRLLDDNQLAEFLGREGRKSVVENYSWDRVADKFNEILATLSSGCQNDHFAG